MLLLDVVKYVKNVENESAHINESYLANLHIDFKLRLAVNYLAPHETFHDFGNITVILKQRFLVKLLKHGVYGQNIL